MYWFKVYPIPKPGQSRLRVSKTELSVFFIGTEMLPEFRVFLSHPEESSFKE